VVSFQSNRANEQRHRQLGLELNGVVRRDDQVPLVPEVEVDFRDVVRGTVIRHEGLPMVQAHDLDEGRALRMEIPGFVAEAQVRDDHPIERLLVLDGGGPRLDPHIGVILPVLHPDPL